VLHILARPDRAPALQELMFAETGTLGVRRSPVTRTAPLRRTTTVDLGGVPVRVKHGPHGAKPEHDDLAAAAAQLGLSLPAAAAQVRALGGPDTADTGQAASAGHSPVEIPRDQEGTAQ
jgi:pyridinium-3,5-bisthiocarboxylic acid mononucleotide nickel chelatase